MIRQGDTAGSDPAEEYNSMLQHNPDQNIIVIP